MITRQPAGVSVMFMIVAGFIIPACVFAQDKMFSGLYAGVEVGRNEIIGGSRVDNVDFLSQDSRAVVGFQGGWRHQFGMGLVVGVEGSLGLMDGTLNLSEPASQLDITYENNRQTTIGLTGGFAFGADKRWLLFAYISEATRNFDVTINQAGAMFAQKDEQGMLRYGIGVERQFIGPLNLRLSVGTGRADFGDRQTNIDVQRRLEFAVGALLQL